MTARDSLVISDSTVEEMQRPAASRGVVLQAKEVAIRSRAGVVSASDVSFHIEPGELVAVAGLAYAEKSTLLQSLAGLRRPESGKILIDGVDLYENIKAFRSVLGFVPADSALLQELTVGETIRYAATLRLPRRTSDQDRGERMLTLMKAVGLRPATDRRVESLSRAEKRRLSIALELIGDPGLLVIDESAESLSPFDEMQLAVLLQKLSRQGITIVQGDQRLRSAGMSDKILLLAPGGSLVWFGPVDEAAHYLRGFVPKGIARDVFGLKEALEVLANPQEEKGVEWAERFRANEAYQKYVDDPLQNRYPDLLLQTSPLMRLRLRDSSKEKLPPRIIPRASVAQKLSLMIDRSLRVLGQKRRALAVLLIPPLVALVDLVLSRGGLADPSRLPILSGVLVFLSLLTAALLAQNEIFKERAVYQRESRTTSLSFPYVLSKALLVGILAVYEGFTWSLIHFVAAGLAGGIAGLALYAAIFVLVAFVGGLLGLLASALSRSPQDITSYALLLAIPQLLLNGSTIPLAGLAPPLRVLSALNPSRYAVEALLAAGGQGAALNRVPWSQLSILAVLSLCLIGLLLVIQHRAESAGT